MNRFLAGIAIGILLGLSGYSLLTFFSSNEFVADEFARVTIRNESGKNARRIVLQHGRGSLEARGLRDMEEIRFIFRNGGENSYKIIATFDNDRTLTSDEVYFEHGYRGVETINESAISTTLENSWW
jgi:hypothetical protein